jgi:hypothetical protein
VRTFAIVCAAVVALAALVATPARADSSEATCEVRKDGDTRKGTSGPCTFSQRQGYIDVDLRNGETISLRPGNQANNFKDQKGNKVVRTQAGGNTHVYKWDNGKKLTVTFDAASSSSGGGGRGGSDVSSNAKSACMTAVNGKYGGDVRDLKVVRSEFSQANSDVIVDAVGVRGSSATERWRCLVSNDGKVQDLSVLPR